MTNDVKRSTGFRLLPDDSYLGWTPYVWLAYFPIFFAAPVYEHASAQRWAATIGAGLLFLALYFRGYWTRGRELLLIIVAIASIGFVFMPTNTGASVFVTYAAAFAGVLYPRRVALGVLTALGAGVVMLGSLTGVRPEWMVFQLFLAGSVGLANLHFARVREMNGQLRLARDEVEHLARVAERERIARDLHDVLGHTLTLITLKSALAARVAEKDPARASEEMREIERVSRNALNEVRAAVTGYRDVGLAGEVKSAKMMLQAAGVAVVHDVAPVALSPIEEAALALVVREAVTNVVRHAGATLCRITLSIAEGSRELSIEDNGRGKQAPDGNGLSGMRERVATLGGRLIVDPLTPGTRVRIMLTSAR